MIARANVSGSAGVEQLRELWNRIRDLLNSQRAGRITPVEETNTSDGVHPRAAATASADFSVAASPFAPFEAFAFPELTMTALATCPDFCKWSRETMTGAAGNALRVKIAAAVAGRSE